MFRFEVHVRITDDPSVTTDSSDTFLFSTLFSEDTAADHTEALLSTLRGEDLCCEGEPVITVHILICRKNCEMEKPQDHVEWANLSSFSLFTDIPLPLLLRGSEGRCSDEDRSGTSCWSSEEEHSLEFDCDESKALWESLSRSNDPYDPLCFSACISTRSKGLWETRSPASCSPVSESNKMEQSQKTQETGSKESHVEEELWSAMTKEQDPYHPLNFTVLQWREEEMQRRKGREDEPIRRRRRGEKPELTQRKIRRHSHPQFILCPWTKTRDLHTGVHSVVDEVYIRSLTLQVRFSNEVKVHVMRSWRFAHEAARRGQWEESARDRDRFRRRIQEVDRTVGPILRQEHRERVWARIRPGLNLD
uniref:Protein DP71L n=1 Tax=Periophthalmus magnuspinnatus TaxID=409849 RepID=A0A3B4BCX1_9GOBI